MPEHPSDTKVLRVKMEFLLEPTSNKILKDIIYLIYSYRVVCFETFWYIANVVASFQRSQIHIIKLSMSNHCMGRFHYNQDYPPQEVVDQSRSQVIRSKVRDLDIGGVQRFKTSTLREIVSLEKSNKNVNGLHPTSRLSFISCTSLWYSVYVCSYGVWILLGLVLVFNKLTSYVLGMEHHYMVFHLVNGVRASCVEMICEMDFVRYGYDCQPQFPLNYESEPGYIENYNMIHRVFHNKSFVVKIVGFFLKPTIIKPHNIPLSNYSKEARRKAANARYWEIPVCCDDDDDYNSAITPNEPVDSLSMGDERLNTISATESDEFIKSCVENLVPNLSESEGENGCDVPACFTTFSNILFDADHNFHSVDDQSLSNEDIPEKIFSNPLSEEEIISMKIDPHHFNIESDLIESLRIHDSSIIPSSSKIDSLLDEFAGELTLLKSIPPGIDKTDCYHENEILLTKRLLYDNSSPSPPKEFVSENSNAKIESFSPSPIPDEDSDSRMEEIDLSFNPNDPMPPSIEEDDDDSERDILIHEELLDNYSLSLPVNESFNFDIPLFSRPSVKPLNGKSGVLNIKMMGDISKQKVPMPGLMITLVSNQEKAHNLLSHRGLEIFQPSAKCPMMIYGKNIPILDVPLFYFYPLNQFKYGELGQAKRPKTSASVV
nr:hypothetical protein [Tanacetum cinerariifolium]